MDPERRIQETLARLGIDHEINPCDPDLADTTAFCEAYGYAAEDSANTIIVVGRSRGGSADPPRYAACVVLAHTRLDVNGVVRRRLGTRKASFANADDTVALTGMMIGGVTPFALPADVPVWIDAQVMTRTRIVLGGGSRSSKVVGPPRLIRALPSTEIVDGLAGPPSV